MGSTPPQRISLVVNPSSGRGRAERLLPRVVDQLHDRLPTSQLDVQRSASYDDAVELCTRAVAGGTDALLVMGGDGMAHVGINACATTGVPLGVIPAGTGNDFCRGARLPRLVGPAVQAVIGGRTRRIDLAEVTRSDGRREFVGSVVNTGFDARVSRRTSALPDAFGPISSLAYAGIALAELAAFRPLHYRLVGAGGPRELDAMFVTIANGGHMGGGMHVAPEARVDDGQLDLVIVHPVSRGVLLKLLPRIFSGGHASHPAVEIVRCTQVRVEGDGLFAIGDGEELGGAPVEVACRPASLAVFGA